MTIIIRNFVRFPPKFKTFLNSITNPTKLTGVKLFPLKEDIEFEIKFVTVSWLKNIKWYISLHVIHNTLSVFIMNAPTVLKKIKNCFAYI